MAKKALERELLALEKRYWQALKDHDVKTALSLTDEQCIVTGAQGVGNLDKAKLAQMLKAPSYTMNDFEIDDDVQVRMLNDDVAIVAYKVHEDLTVEGKPVSIDAADASTWVRRNGGWRCALHSESLTGDPFGRDRKRTN